jgi:hypothetical protein
VFRSQIRIHNAEPDPEGVKRAKRRESKAKGRSFAVKSIKSYVVCVKKYVTLFSNNFLFVLVTFAEFLY